MPTRRSSRSVLEMEEEPLARRNLRRRGTSRSSKKTVGDDEDGDTDPMDVDESSSSSEESENPEDGSSDEDSDEQHISQMIKRRRSREAESSSRRSTKGGKADSKKQKGKGGSRRQSSRSTRFKSSMKEPPSESVRDLFQSTSTRQRTTSSRRKSEDESSSEDEAPKPAKRTKATSSSRSRKPKSPARNHSRARKSVKADDSSDEDESEQEDYDMEDEEQEENMKIQRILASRTETRAKWSQICQKMNSSEVTDGSRWFQDTPEDGSTFEERFLVKWNTLSYMHVSWETQDDLLDQVDGAKGFMSRFFRKSENGILLSQDDRKDGDYFDPGYCQIDRVLDVSFDGKMPKTVKDEEAASNDDFGIVLDKKAKDFEDGTGREILIKWQCLNYSESTWEYERDLILADVDYKEHMNAYHTKTSKPTKRDMKSAADQGENAKRRAYRIFGDSSKLSDEKREEEVESYKKQLADHVFMNGGQLRDYQAEGVAWMLSNYVNSRSCILADEMGLGKTLQTAAFVNLLTQKMHRRGPFLLVVPLSTVAHWQREFIGWTGLNTIVYHGSADDRKYMRELEFAYPRDRPESVGANASYLKKCDSHRTRGPWMAQVVVTTPQMLNCDDTSELTAINWEVLVVDEAHILKNHSSKLASTLRNPNFSFKHKILLTGTPIQNEVKEFWTLMNFIDPSNFADMHEFLEEYGDIKSKESIDKLHEIIRPYILRRLKEDVEKSVPPKEETLIEVELTLEQKQYYRALYEKNVGFLHKNKKKALDGPSLNNLAMQLRKCCNHLFLLNGVEEEVKTKEKQIEDEGDFLARGSGKLVLLDKLLPRLKEKGHRVLLFSQFKIMLDVLEDYFTAREMSFERIDGSITGHKRQAAIDRYQDKTSKDPPFVMLLSTKAGGVGINLTAADTCIIFDSDWNPQNDLQAQARCHRIGQTKSVKVYRLLTRKTYEMQMFHMSSLKMGLDQAVLKGFESGSSGEGALTKEEVEKLLRHGAYDIFNEEKAGTAEAESKDFVQQDIDSILERRSRTVVHHNTGSKSNAAGGTFSKASFVAPKNAAENKTQTEDIDIEDPEFWTKMVGEAPPEEKEMLKPRKRNKANYSEKAYERQFNAAIVDADDSASSDSSSDEFDSSDDETAEVKERSRWGGQKLQHWKRTQAEGLLKALEMYGYGAVEWKKFISEKLSAAYVKFPEEEVRRMAWSIVLLALVEGARDEAIGAQKRAERQAEKKRESAASTETAPVSISKEALQGMIDTAFRKHWMANVRWGRLALADAVDFARKNEPRQRQTTEQKSQQDEIQNVFYTSVWPSLTSRGWKEEERDGYKVFLYEKNKFDSPRAVLNQVCQYHKELANMVIPLLQTLEQSRLNATAAETAERNRHLSLSAQSVTYESLKEFLQRYAPLQLLSDRQSGRKLPINRRILSSCNYVYLTRILVHQASSQGENGNMEALLHVNSRAALPHPLWTQKHDAVLIQSIAKHGWVDREKCCKAIIEDPSIKWGYPFELVKDEKTEQIEEETKKKLRSTAKRAASFLNDHHELVENMKGCNRHLIIESFGLKHDSSDTESPGTVEWVVDEEMLCQMKSSSDEALDLPAKKDMAKRAKMVLQESIAALESGYIPGSARGMNASKAEEEKANEKKYDYAVIDQGNRVCVLLAEMVRGIVKGSQTKMARQVRMLCSLAYEEAVELQKIYAQDASKPSLVDSKEMDDPKTLTEELKKIADQIALVKRSLKTAAIPAKNVLRVMLGLDPVTPKNQSESLFPTQSSIDDTAPTKQSTKKETTRRDDGALGEKAIARGMKKAYDKSDGNPCTFKAKDDSDNGLQLTMIETLVLFTCCSEGIPLILDQVDKTGITWSEFASVLEICAKDYSQTAKEKLNKCRNTLMKLESHGESDARVQAAKRVAVAEQDQCTKEEAAQIAADFASNPEKLAKKCIMLVEKVRRFGFANTQSQGKNAHKLENCLGPKVQTWLGKELTKAASTFGVVDGSGTTMCLTFTDLLEKDPEYSNIRVAAFMDKKACRQVVSQISLLGRLRSVFSRNDVDALRTKVTSAVRNSKKIEDVWEKRPEWWQFEHNYLLLQRLNQHGFFNILNDSSGFGPADHDGHKSLRELGLNKTIIQQRANQLVRELHSLEESEEMMRMLEERRSRVAAKKQGYDKSLAECHTKTNTKKSSGGKRRSGGIQTGLRAFFTTTKSVSKKQKVVLLADPDCDSSSSSSVSPGKRKDLGSDEEGSPRKKAKKSSFFTVLSGHSSDSSPITPEKKIRTVVNDDGVIELVRVPR